MSYWAIFEGDKLRTNMESINLKPLKLAESDGSLKLLKYSSKDEARHSLITPGLAGFKAKNKNKECSYIILEVYE